MLNDIRDIEKELKNRLKYDVHINGKVTNRNSENDLENVIFTCLKDDEIKYANEWKKKNQ